MINTSAPSATTASKAKAKHKTQRQMAAEGKARELATFKARLIKGYDTNLQQCQGFIRGLMRSHSADCPPLAELLEQFITENQLNGTLLRQTFTTLSHEQPGTPRP